MYKKLPTGTRRLCDVESTSLTLIQRRNNVVCAQWVTGRFRFRVSGSRTFIYQAPVYCGSMLAQNCANVDLPECERTHCPQYGSTAHLLSDSGLDGKWFVVVILPFEAKRQYMLTLWLSQAKIQHLLTFQQAYTPFGFVWQYSTRAGPHN